MAKVLAARGPICDEHPHRDAVDHCDACGHRFCRECLVRGPQLLCRTCFATLPALERERRRRRRPDVRLRLALAEHRASVVAGAVIAVVLALVALPAATQVTGASWQRAAGTGAQRAAAASGALGGAASGESAPVNAPAPAAPGAPTRIPTLVFGIPQPVTGSLGINPAALTDGRAGDGAAVWRTNDGRVTAELRYASGAYLVGRAIFAHSTAAPPETWAKEVEVWLSANPDEPESVRAGRWTLAQTTAPQSFTFPRALMRSARLRILSNHGSAAYTSLAEFALLGG